MFSHHDDIPIRSLLIYVYDCCCILGLLFTRTVVYQDCCIPGLLYTRAAVYQACCIPGLLYTRPVAYHNTYWYLVLYSSIVLVFWWYNRNYVKTPSIISVMFFCSFHLLFSSSCFLLCTDPTVYLSCIFVLFVGL